MFLISLSVFSLAVFWFFWAVIVSIVGSMSGWLDSTIIVWDWSGLGVGFVLILLVILFANSQLAESLLRFVTGSRRTIQREKDALLPILEEVQEDIKTNCGYEKKDIKLWVSDEVMPNAWAIGKRTMVISRGLYDSANVDQIKGVMAHELGHLHAGDSRKLSIAVFLSYFIMIFLWIGSISAVILSALSRIKTKQGPVGLILLPLIILVFIPILLIRFCNWLFNIVLNWTGRKQEYKADLFAVKSGHGGGLLSFLEVLKDFEFDKKSVMERLFSTHPPVMLRIDQVEKAIKGTEIL